VARAQFGQGNYRAALRGLAPLLSELPSKETLILAIRAAIRAEETGRARELARRLLSLPGAGAEELYYAGMVESSSGEFQKAISLYARALGEDPAHQGARAETVAALGHLGRAALRRRDLSAARQLVERARRVDPGSSVVDRNLGLLELYSGRPDRAVVPLGRALRRAPNDPAANHLMGRALAATGQLVQAEQHLERAVAASHDLGPATFARTLMAAAAVRARLGKPFGAMVDLTQAANVLGRSHPELEAQVRARLARVHVALGIAELAHGKEQAGWRAMRAAVVESGSLGPAERAEVRAAILLGAAARGQLEQGQRLLGGAPVDLRLIIRAAYAPITDDLIGAFADYFAKDSDRQLRAAASFERMAGKLDALARAKLLEMALRSQLRAAAELFTSAKVAEARQVHLQTLRGVADPPAIWRHNAAVLGYASGDQAAAVEVLKGLVKEVPVAACNLAVDREQAFDLWEAYRLFKECKARGAQFPKLDEILAAKRAVFEGEQ